LSFEGKQEDKESGKQANFYFRGLTPFPSMVLFPIGYPDQEKI